jgi:hypothetical protein
LRFAAHIARSVRLADALEQLRVFHETGGHEMIQQFHVFGPSKE